MDGFDTPWSRGARLPALAAALQRRPPALFAGLSANRLQMRRRTYGRWHGGDRFQNPGSNLVGFALRIRTAVFEIAFVAVLCETVRYTDWCASVCDPVAE